MAKLYLQNLFRELDPALSSRGMKELAKGLAAEQLINKKKDLIDELEEHPVTREIRAGPTADNISKTLFGIEGGGNLFSFIGFKQSEDPIQPIIDVLERGTIIKGQGKILRSGSNFSYLFDVSIPPIQAIYEKTKYPDEWMGESWVKGIETHIPGTRWYLYIENARSKMYSFGESRSGTAYQLENSKINPSQRVVNKSGRFKPTKYLSTILQRFRAKFRGPGGRF